MPQIGPYELHTVETGRFGLDGGAMFGVVPKPLWEKKIAADERNRIPLAMRCLLLEGEDRLILIDNGLGDTFDDKFADIYAVDHEHSELHRSLGEVGFSAEDVTDVVLTHLHFDHCGGTTTRGADGDLELTFPNARHHVQDEHWSWAMDPPVREGGSFLDDNLEPLADSGQLTLLNGEGELFPGVEVGTVFGHTTAQQIVRVADEERTLVFAADLLPTHAHARTAWTMAYDVRPLRTEKERRTFLEDAAAQGWHVFFEHDPDVAVADVQRTEQGFQTTNHRSLRAL
ncbi:MAG: MBL fold metallo-hydrolase [Bacteroidetes bacterium QS_8_64_10]|jgi:glyoxylase-like metal-dependent hydrolase (beta-lactamase superfamily II)|nr:MAG: MBL fold metallo-hydrolase [Bacteroidetes bacterium QS_8_64_10]